MLFRSDPPLASFRLPTPLFQAKFTPEELNFVGILDDGADSPFVLSLQGPLGEHWWVDAHTELAPLISALPPADGIFTDI